MREPLDLIRFLIDEPVQVILKGSRRLCGRLHAFDEHMNLVLGDTIERVDAASVGRSRGMLYVRGDSIVLVSPNAQS